VVVAVDGEDEVLGQNAFPFRPKGHKSSKVDLNCDAEALALAEIQEALSNMDEKRHREKEASTTTFIDITKQPIEFQRMEAAAKLLAEENRIMFIELRIMDPDQMVWFEKKLTIIREHDA
jgi:hypothetical protein